MTRRLLLLSCSARKRNDPALLPAIDRYDMRLILCASVITTAFSFVGNILIILE